MIRFASLQFRLQAAVAFGVLAVVAVMLGQTGPHLAVNAFCGLDADGSSSGG